MDKNTKGSGQGGTGTEREQDHKGGNKGNS